MTTNYNDILRFYTNYQPNVMFTNIAQKYQLELEHYIFDTVDLIRR